MNIKNDQTITNSKLENINSNINLILEQKTFEKFAKYILENTGIVLKQSKKTLLANRLRKRIKKLNLSSYEDYWQYLLNKNNHANEILFFLDAISTNETYFQRGTNHYKILSNEILPELLSKGQSKFRIWSAGCSTGEEVYDIAMELEEFKEKNPYISYKIIATDISQEVLKFAKKGIYADRRIAKLSTYQRVKYFNKIDSKDSGIPFAKDTIQVKDFLKKNIQFYRINLVKDLYPTDLDVIFCRNVMIYFNKETQLQIVNNFGRSLAENRYLFIGHSETLRVIESDLVAKRFEEGTVYTNAKSN